MIAPKQRCLVRPVHLLDPLDTVLYTTLSLRLANTLQAERDRYQPGRVFSWQFDLAATGTREVLRSDWWI